MRLVLYQPDIPQNTAAMLRLAACLGVPVDVIEPCGFVWDERRMRRVGMDYLDLAELRRHASWAAYAGEPRGRLILLTTAGSLPVHAFQFRADDSLMMGRESAGVPAEIHEAVDARLVLPLRPRARSLNVALAAAMALGEALRQTDLFPKPYPEEAER